MKTIKYNHDSKLGSTVLWSVSSGQHKIQLNYTLLYIQIIYLSSLMFEMKSSTKVIITEVIMKKHCQPRTTKKQKSCLFVNGHFLTIYDDIKDVIMWPWQTVSSYRTCRFSILFRFISVFLCRFLILERIGDIDDTLLSCSF